MKNILLFALCMICICSNGQQVFNSYYQEAKTDTNLVYACSAIPVKLYVSNKEVVVNTSNVNTYKLKRQYDNYYSLDAATMDESTCSRYMAVNQYNKPVRIWIYRYKDTGIINEVRVIYLKDKLFITYKI